MLFVVGVCCQEMSCRVSLLWSSSRPQSNLAVSSCLLNKQFLDNSRFLCNFPMNSHVRLLLACQFSKRARSYTFLLLLEHLLFILILIKSYRNNFLGIIWRNEICFFLGKNLSVFSAIIISIKINCLQASSHLCSRKYDNFSLQFIPSCASGENKMQFWSLKWRAGQSLANLSLTAAAAEAAKGRKEGRRNMMSAIWHYQGFKEVEI